MEFPHVLKLIKDNQFDTIYHEHFFYYSLQVVKDIFANHNLRIYDVETLDTHGGSLRIYATHTNNDTLQTTDNVKNILLQEQNDALDKMEGYIGFAECVRKIKRDALNVLGRIKEDGKTIAAFGAAAKGNTFLNYCGIGLDYVDFVADSSTEKQGLFLPGTRIPIVAPNYIRERKPDYIVILPWNIKDEIADNLKYTKEWDCKLITFIPQIGFL